MTTPQREAEEALAKELGFKLFSVKDRDEIVWYRKAKLNEREATYEEIILWNVVVRREAKLQAYQRAVEEMEQRENENQSALSVTGVTATISKPLLRCIGARFPSSANTWRPYMTTERTVYRGYVIEPLGANYGGFTIQFTHDDYDGPEHPGHGVASSVEDAKQIIDGLVDTRKQHDSQATLGIATPTLPPEGRAPACKIFRAAL